MRKITGNFLNHIVRKIKKINLKKKILVFYKFKKELKKYIKILTINNMTNIIISVKNKKNINL